MKIKGIIFDCDGTLIDSEGLHLQAWKMAVQKRGFELHDELYFSLAGQTAETIAEKLYSLIGKDSPQKIVEDKRAFYRTLQQATTIPIIRTLCFLKELQNYDVKLGVASAAPKEEILINLRAMGIEKDFHTIISGVEDLAHIHDPEGVNKPKPYIYLHAALTLGLNPSECVAFEDTSFGVQAAKTAGLKTIAVPNLYTKKQDFSAADLIINSEDPINIHQIL